MLSRARDVRRASHRLLPRSVVADNAFFTLLKEPRIRDEVYIEGGRLVDFRGSLSPPSYNLLKFIQLTAPRVTCFLAPLRLWHTFKKYILT